MMKTAGSGSKYGPDLNPDPLVRGMDPQIRIRIHTKMSWIRNTDFSLISEENKDLSGNRTTPANFDFCFRNRYCRYRYTGEY
jgi:hypothetical protein